MNYFELFDLPVSLNIDKALLSKQYFALQKKYHPDFFTNATEAEQEEALETSSQVNKAFKTFKDQDATIKYVLQLKGVLEEEEKYQLPPDFLMEVMELNEELSDHSAQQIRAFEADIYAAVKGSIEQYDDSTVTPQQLQAIKEYYFKKKYLQRILDRMAD
jgi:molecular chaperone HscB